MSDHDGSHEDCFACKLRSIQFDPRAMPSRRNHKPPRVHVNRNSWEKGIPRDSRGMPVLIPGTTSPMGTKEYSRNRRLIDQRKRDLNNS